MAKDNGWKGKKVIVTLLALAGVAAAMAYAFVNHANDVMIAALAALGLVTGAYVGANAWQQRGYAGSGPVNNYDGQDGA